MAEEKKVILTREGYQKLEQELNYYISVRRNEISEQIAIARGFGDLSENAEYDEAKNEQGKLYSRIAEIEGILQNCVVLEDDEEHPHHAVRIGSKIRVLDEDYNEEMAYSVVGSQEADPMNGRISEDSPFGKALLGKTEGESVVVEAPAGSLRFKILAITK